MPCEVEVFGRYNLASEFGLKPVPYEYIVNEDLTWIPQTDPKCCMTASPSSLLSFYAVHIHSSSSARSMHTPAWGMCTMYTLVEAFSCIQALWLMKLGNISLNLVIISP